MSGQREVTLWPSRENYPRFAALCDDEVPATFGEFESKAGARVEELAKQGVAMERIAFDPENMATWCREHFGAINSRSRAAYAGFLALAD